MQNSEEFGGLREILSIDSRGTTDEYTIQVYHFPIRFQAGQFMLYDRSQSIERRLEEILDLVKEGRSSAPSIAKSLGVSVPTVSRCIEALRRRGFAIRSEKLGIAWRYKLDNQAPISKRSSKRVQEHAASQ